MSIVIRKGLIGKEDVSFYSAASPTFSRLTSTGGATTITAIAATHIPITTSAASYQFSANNVNRAINQLGAFAKTNATLKTNYSSEHCYKTYAGGAVAGNHLEMMGFRNGAAATSIQAAASNQFLKEGIARIILPEGTYTVATPIQLPRKCWIYGNGRGTIVRASSTIQTSRVFTISGSLAATSSNLTANASMNGTLVDVVNSAGFAVGQWIKIEDSIGSELNQIKSISGNSITVSSGLLQTYRSAATTKKATLAYPAELHMDHMDIQLSSATQGIGVAATYVVRSMIGEDVNIGGAAISGVLLRYSTQNKAVPTICYPKSIAAGYGYGVRLQDSYVNSVGGFRDGTTKDVADGKSFANWTFGSVRKGIAVASGMSDPISLWYRKNKPNYGHVIYAGTRVVACYGSTNSPADVYIGGKVYSNSATTLCRLDGTRTPSTATVGGLECGSVSATHMYHLYAVPSLFPTATRQWDMMCSQSGPATGPLVSATYPLWSHVGIVPVEKRKNDSGGSAVCVPQFYQNGNELCWDGRAWDNNLVGNLFTDSSPAAAQATIKEIISGLVPTSAKAAKVKLMVTSAYERRGTACDYYVTSGDGVIFVAEAAGGYAGVSVKTMRTGASVTQAYSDTGWVGINPSNRSIGYSTPSAASYNIGIELCGIYFDRSAYK